MFNELSPKLAEEVLQEYLKILAGWLFVSKSTGRARISSLYDPIIRQVRVGHSDCKLRSRSIAVVMSLHDSLLLTAWAGPHGLGTYSGPFLELSLGTRKCDLLNCFEYCE